MISAASARHPSGIRYLTPLLFTALLACDQSAGLDPQPRLTFTRLAPVAACPVGEREVEVSLHLMSGPDALGPQEVWPRLRQTVEQLVTPDVVRFERSRARLPSQVRFVATGGAARADDPLLVVLAVDHSASLIGIDPFTGAVDLAQASDPRDARTLYLQQVVEALPEDAWVSLVCFNGELIMLDQACMTPTRDRALIRACLKDLELSERGLTPLADGLDHSLRVISANDDLNPVVLLFTDGVEDGDASLKTLDALRADYVAAEVPVVVLDLQPSPESPWPGGPSAELADLACATGGAYLFFETPQDLDPGRADVVAHRLSGSWRVQARADLDADLMTLEGALSVTVAGSTQSGLLDHIWVGR